MGEEPDYVCSSSGITEMDIDGFSRLGLVSPAQEEELLGLLSKYGKTKADITARMESHFDECGVCRIFYKQRKGLSKVLREVKRNIN